MPEIQAALFDNHKSARFSLDRLHRYELRRRWQESGPWLNFIMLNPSTADEFQNDPTVERCERRAVQMGFAGLIVTNLFAFRATDPAVMRAAADPIGPENDKTILGCAIEASMVICAWGNDGQHLGRSATVLKLLRGIELHALKLTKIGEPYHPLYVGYKVQPSLMKVRG